MPTTPNMGLALPTVQLTIGPDWASDLNTALEDVDQHDHSPGSGVQLGTASISINADLTFNSFAAISLERTGYSDQLAALTDPRSIYTVGGDLYYTNTAGDQVQITAGAAINSTPGSFQGLGDGGSSGQYYDGTKTAVIFHAGTSQAKWALSDTSIYPFDATGTTPYTIPVTIKTPTSIASAYDLTLPAAPAAQATIVGMSSTGALSAGADVGTFTAPSITFATDLDTGMYRFGSNELGFTAGGVRQMEMRSSYIRSQVIHAFVDGSAASPGITFENDQDNGFYRITTNAVGLTLAGVQRIDFSPNAFVLKPDGTEVGRFTQTQLQMVGGSAAAPAYSFGSDSNTGVYNVAADRLGISSGGTRRLIVDSGGIYWTPSGTEIGGSRIKFRVFSGNLLAAASTTLTCPSDGTRVLGVVGQKALGGVITYGTAGTLRFETAALANDTDVVLTNGAGGALDYRVIMYYQ